MVSYIDDGNIKDITFVDGDQMIKATPNDGKKVRAVAHRPGHPVARQGREASSPREHRRRLQRRGAQAQLVLELRHVPPGHLDHLVLPLHVQQHARRRRTGDAVRQVQGQDGQQGHTQDHLRRRCRGEEAIEELGEIKEFLQQPAKFQAVGAKIPKGVLLYGPPGTGKTLLARAVAGEAAVPFYSISGSDFVEMFVGVGACRVRDLFEQAKENAPAIVFIDEIDAVGRHRGAGLGGGHDEREQTLNQLLVEMDGFDVRGGVILIAATNRPDVLDPALLRPAVSTGRSASMRPTSRAAQDPAGPRARQADRAGRRPAAVGRRTPASPAPTSPTCSTRRPCSRPARQEDDRRRSRSTRRSTASAGPAEAHSHLMSDKEAMTAYHEGGHALVAAALPGTDPVTKITILPRGRALGYTQVLPEEDKSSASRAELLDQLAYALGGLAAEQLIFHDPTTGSSTTSRRRPRSPERWSPVRHERSARCGQARRGQRRAVPRPRHRPHAEVLRGGRRDHRRRDQQAALERAPGGLRHPLQNRDVLDTLVEELLEKETIDKAGSPRSSSRASARDRPAWTGSDTRIPSTVPPVAGSLNGREPKTTGHVIGPDTGPDAPMPGAPADGLVGEPTGAPFPRARSERRPARCRGRGP